MLSETVVVRTMNRQGIVTVASSRGTVCGGGQRVVGSSVRSITVCLENVERVRGVHVK